MLSNQNLVDNSFFKYYPMKLLLVDEASQIRTDQYPRVVFCFPFLLLILVF